MTLTVNIILIHHPHTYIHNLTTHAHTTYAAAILCIIIYPATSLLIPANIYLNTLVSLHIVHLVLAQTLYIPVYTSLLFNVFFLINYILLLVILFLY